jgi:RNA polymerase sigma factor (sigma-70 family)
VTRTGVIETHPPTLSLAMLTTERARPAAPPDTPEQALVRAALAGEADAMRALVRLLRPTVQAEVAWSLQRFAPRGRGRDPRQELGDMVQEVFLALLDNDGRILSAWDPERGRSLTSFVQLVARHQVASVLRSNRRCPWTEDPTPVEEMVLEPAPSPEHRVVEADEARRAMGHLRGELSTRSMLMFEELYVEERSVDEVCETYGLSREALYAWRSRLKRKMQSILRKLGRDPR